MITLLCGDNRAILPTLPDESVQCVVTSPPYYGLRDYGVDGQIGLEQTPDAYVANLVAVFREVRRVLKEDGTCWLNLGDSYAGSNCGSNDHRENGASISLNNAKYQGQKPGLPDGLKPKDLVGIPWRVAFALQADGWWLRQDIIWHKPNPMPESVTDRCTKAHEYVFLLTKSARYYYDNEAVKEPSAYDGRKDTMMKGSAKYKDGYVPGQSEQTMAARGHERWLLNADGERVRNRRDVWSVSTQPYREAHFAVMPEKLVEPCILAGSKAGDVVLDPFNGAGTVGVVATRLGRNYIGIELNPEYIEMAERRIAQVQPALVLA